MSPAALPRPLLCLVTDRRVAPMGLPEAVASAVEGGVDLVQLREKDLPAADLLALALELRQAVVGRALLLVNDRLDVALAAEAEGVHLPETGLPVPVARRLAGPDLLVGRSVHSAEAAALAVAAGADYALVGTIFPSASHPGWPAAGPQLVRAARAVCRGPLIAIGGINESNLREVITAGADGVAVITAILGQPDPAQAAASLKAALVAAWSRSGRAAQGIAAPARV